MNKPLIGLIIIILLAGVILVGALLGFPGLKPAPKVQEIGLTEPGEQEIPTSSGQTLYGPSQARETGETSETPTGSQVLDVSQAGSQSPYSPSQPPKADDSGWTKQGVQEVVKANNRFAFDLYSKLSQSEKENLFFSPYSLSAALAMTYEGAKGQTAQEMKSVFHFPDENILRPNFAKIYNSLNQGSTAYELKTGNALWAQKDYPFLKDYLTRVEKYYGGKASSVDFYRETEKARQTINRFIEEQTKGKIKDLIPPDALTSDIRLILTNAIYFKGNWVWQFDPKMTEEMNFKITPTNIVKTPMMFMKPKKAMFNYADLKDLQILELPYEGEKISMLILLPKENLQKIEPLTREKLQEWQSKMKATELDAIFLPKFKLETQYSLKDALIALGMPTAFSQAADFSGMTGGRDLYVKFVFHQAFVQVDEKGTEAAAATAVGMEEIMLPPPKPVFKADHPFIFIIQDKETGNILFLGRVVDPTKEK